MAWKARVVKKTLQRVDFVLSVEFFDDAAPASVLLREDMAFPPGISRSELLAEVKARGARERAIQANLRTISDLVNVGDEVAI
jgi:hypothetical protein